MGAHNETSDIYESYSTKTQLIDPPASGGTFNLKARWGCYCTVPAGTYKLPDNMPLFGARLTVYATGNVTLTNAAGVTVTTLVSGQFCVVEPTSAATWGVVAHSAIYTAATTAQGFIPIPLTALREVSTGAVGNAAANGGLLASDTTPTLSPLNGATDPTQLVTWASSNNDVLMFQVPIPPDIDTTHATPLEFHFIIASGGTTNAVGFTVNLMVDGAQAVEVLLTNTNQTTAFLERTALNGAAVGAGQTLTVLLTPFAHTTDTLRMKACWIEYKKALLSS